MRVAGHAPRIGYERSHLGFEMSCDTTTMLFRRGKRCVEDMGLEWVDGFGDLHDHCDANGVTSIDFDFEWEPGIVTETAEGTADFGLINHAHDALHAWLRHLAPSGTWGIE